MTCEFVTKIIRLFKFFVNKYKNGREIGYNTNIIIEEKEKKMAVQTVRVADKPTVDEVKSTVENNASRLDDITKFLEHGGGGIK